MISKVTYKDAVPHELIKLMSDVPNPNLVRSPSENTANVLIVPADAMDRQEKTKVTHFMD